MFIQGATFIPDSRVPCTYVVYESPQPACYSPYLKKAAKTFVSDKQPALNERTVESWSQKHFFFAMAISFYSIRYKLYPRIHTSILCHPVSRLRLQPRPAGRQVSQSVRRGPRRPVGSRAEGRPGQSAGWLTLSPCSSFEPCQRVRFLSASECLTTSQRYATFQAGKITNLDLIKKP